MLAASYKAPVTILFTHDLHDNLLPFKTENNGKVEERGGYARLQTLIQQQREKDPQLLLMDGGDYSMGTLFQSIFSQEAPGLRLMGQMGYDVVTLGNHEFDFRPEGLASNLDAARNSKERLPQIVAGNISFPADSTVKTTSSLDTLKTAMQSSGVKEYTVLERKGYKIGVFGLIGQDAASNAPMAGVSFTDPLERARRIVDRLKNQEKVDMIICLSHSGTVQDSEESEDVNLAREVPEINVIISGHTHRTLNRPIKVGDTLICSAGEYGQNMGLLTLKKTGSGWQQENYRLLHVNSRVAEDPVVKQRIDTFKTVVQKTYLDPMDLKFDGVLAESPFSFTPISKISDQHAEQPLANLISDAYIAAVKQAEGADYRTVDAAIVPNGTIRASLVKGSITVSDAFNVSSLGIGPDKKSGYPLISVYLTGRELKTACEVDASITPLMPAAQLYISGMTYTFNPHRLIFNKVTDAALLRPDGTREEIDDARLYRVAVGLYSAQMLSVVGEKSFGLLSVVPKTQDGTPITDFEAQIIRDNKNNEVKEWAALAKYIQSFAKVDSTAQIPSYYQKAQGLKLVDNNNGISEFLSHPNTIALVVYGIVALIVLLLILSIRFLIKRRQRVKLAGQNEKI